MDQEKNPWKVSKLEDFLYFCCPECNVKDKSKDFFIKHALDHHPKAKDILLENSEFFKTISIENLDSNVNDFSSDNVDENLEEDSHNDSNFEKYLKCKVKIESINDKKHEEKCYEEKKVFSKEILKKNAIRIVHEKSKINRCETCGKIQNYFS